MSSAPWDAAQEGKARRQPIAPTTGRPAYRVLSAVAARFEPNWPAEKIKGRACASLASERLRRQSPNAAVYSTAHVSAAMARRSQAPVLILTAKYALTIRIAMAIATAAAKRRCRFRGKRPQGCGCNGDSEQQGSERLHELPPLVVPRCRLYPVTVLRSSATCMSIEGKSAAGCNMGGAITSVT